jgi:hypothetical protein
MRVGGLSHLDRAIVGFREKVIVTQTEAVNLSNSLMKRANSNATRTMGSPLLAQASGYQKKIHSLAVRAMSPIGDYITADL